MRLLIDKKEWQEFWINTFFAVCIGAALLFIQSERPFIFVHFTAEDHWGEYGTFVGYLMDEARIAQIKNDWEKSYILLSMGKTYAEMGDNESALKSLKQAHEFTKNGRERHDISEWIVKIEQSQKNIKKEESHDHTH